VKLIDAATRMNHITWLNLLHENGVRKLIKMRHHFNALFRRRLREATGGKVALDWLVFKPAVTAD
jgi:hypothetical protein